MRRFRFFADAICHAFPPLTTLYRQPINRLITCLILIVIFNFISLVLFTPPSIQVSIVDRTVFFLSLLLYGLSLLLFISIIKGKIFISAINPSFFILRFYLILFFSFTIVFYFCVTPLNLGLRIENHFGFASFLISIFSGFYMLHSPDQNSININGFLFLSIYYFK